MSIWTHVVGNIRVDGIPRLDGSNVEGVKKKMGKIATYENYFNNTPHIYTDGEYYYTEGTTLPLGSEGSLMYEVIEYDSGLRWVTIPIWGDLRDYDNTEAITKWWYETLEKLRFIRDACLKIEVEGREPVILTEKPLSNPQAQEG